MVQDQKKPSPSEAQIQLARSRIEQQLQRIVAADRARAQQNNSASIPSTPTPAPQPIPALLLPQPQSAGSLNQTQQPAPAASSTSPPALAIAASPLPLAVEPLPALRKPMGVPSLGDFGSPSPPGSAVRSQPLSVSQVAQMSAGVAGFLQVPPLPGKPVGNAIDLQSSQGKTRMDHSQSEKLQFPLARPAPITSGFGWRIHPVMGTERFHAGIDFGASEGTIVRAAQAGIVVEAGDAGDGYGSKIVIEHPHRHRTLYAHLSSLGVRPGQRVSAGQSIGRVGSTGLSTGPHLHFETQVLTAAGWQAVDPLAE
jgi:murein DD-endopeptidase MepM/ murein hydrolase activator NlpD